LEVLTDGISARTRHAIAAVLYADFPFTSSKSDEQIAEEVRCTVREVRLVRGDGGAT
jgi:hypothetical protein